jgi:uncharacterized membrane protein YbhN (UPF0104 family)
VVAPGRAAAIERPGARDPRRNLTIAAVAGVLLVGLLLAVPGLGPVVDEIAAMDPAWVAVAVALELASCASFVVVYGLFFDRVAAARARALAWTSMAAGVLLPAGGVGGLAIAGWLVHVMGHETGWIIRRSSALYVLTSTVNVVTLVAAGCLALAGLGGPDDLLHAGLPVLVGCALIGLVGWMALRARPAGSGSVPAGTRAELVEGIREAGAVLRRPAWRLAGALGYLWFDMAVLWAALHAIGHAAPVAAIALGYLIGYLANGLPVPGGIGVLDAGLAGAFTLYGVPAVDAAAAVLVYHAIALWVPGTGGLLAFAVAQRGLSPTGEPRRSRRAR